MGREQASCSWRGETLTKPLIFIKVGDCIVPLSHQLNRNGYFRKHVGGKVVMYHRYIWEQHHGPIPEGVEIDHTCNNRACCNINHLQALERSQHRKESNAFRYSALREFAKKRWHAGDITGTELAREFGVSVSAACKWIREWRRSSVLTSEGAA